MLPPLRDRFKITAQLQTYRLDELVTILHQRVRQLGWSVSDDCLAPIAERSFGTPRLAIRLLEAAHRTARSEGDASIDLEHLNRTFLLEQLDELGLGPDEQRYLRLLWAAKAPVRLGVLASKLRVAPRTVSQVVEERLIYLDLIERAQSGRVLTQRGIEHAVKLEEVNRA